MGFKAQSGVTVVMLTHEVFSRFGTSEKRSIGPVAALNIHN